jgi:hypothetical protein
MSSDDERHALDRFVAGLPVDGDALARAVTARAAERTIVIDALLKALIAPEPVVRHRVARRAARMAELDPRLRDALTVAAAQDADDLVRAACAETLRGHGLPVPGEVAVAPRRPWLARLELKVLVPARGTSAPASAVKIMLAYKKDAPGFAATLREDGPGGLRAELHGLPPAFAGTRPALRAATEKGLPLTVIAEAVEPVSDAGDVAISIPAAAGSFDDVARLLRNQADLVVIDVAGDVADDG